MNNPEMAPSTGKASFNLSTRDLLAMGFRRKHTVLLCFFGILLGTVLFVVFAPTRYTATTKFLVEKERMDPIVTAEQTSPVMMRNPVTEEDINSEIEVIKSDDVLRQVVLECGLNNRKSLSEYIFGPATPEKRIAKAADRLSGMLDIQPVKKSDIITVSYTSDNPQLAAHVLRSLGDAYLQKHAVVHTPPGQEKFFDSEAQRYKQNLADVEAQIKEFSKQDNGVGPSVARDLSLQKQAEFHESLQTTHSLLAATEERIKTLSKQAGITPERLTTEVKEADDAQVLQGLKNTLMQLEINRTQLLTKYQPTYPLVQEADKQIAETKAAIASEEAKPLKEQTTDRNPTYAWVDEELAKAKADYAGYKAQESAMQAIVIKYESQARDLEQKGLIEAALEREYKAAEQNYLLYLSKREEARVTNALDSTRIVSVAVAQIAPVPTLPSVSPLLVLLLGTFLAGAVTIAAVFTQEYLDPSFRSSAQVSAELNIPVLAAVPGSYFDFRGSGENGHGRDGGGRRREDSVSASATSVISPVADRE
jgi:uncharacterized protein involved in exopolysaccharide biosynthesis